jgi:endoplasmic reticulum chaperone BiP
LDAIKETQSWLETNSATASTEEFEEQKEKITEIVSPITSKLYADSGAGGMPNYDDEPADHDEL